MEVEGEPVRVQSLAQNYQKVPPQYIQAPENRPNKVSCLSTTSVDESVPVIDLHCDRDILLGELSRACKEWGAFHVTNHEVPLELLDNIRSLGSYFFEKLSSDEKKMYSCNPNVPASEGYGSRMLVASDNSVLDWRDYFDHHMLPLARRNPSHWPEFSNYRHIIEEYSNQMKILSQKLMASISESLGLPSSFIEEAIGDCYQNITVSYYPPCPQPELTLGLQSHSDMGFITLLIQDDVGGLEVLKDGKWLMIDPLSHGILVILADQMEVLTNGIYKSAVHRAVTNANRARLSVATFHDPAKTRLISSAFDPPRYRAVLYGDYVSSWYTKGPDGKRNIDALLL